MSVPVTPYLRDLPTVCREENLLLKFLGESDPEKGQGRYNP